MTEALTETERRLFCQTVVKDILLTSETYEGKHPEGVHTEEGKVTGYAYGMF